MDSPKPSLPLLLHHCKEEVEKTGSEVASGKKGWVKERWFMVQVYCLFCNSDSIGSKLNYFLSPGPVSFAHDVNLSVLFPCPGALHCFFSSAQLRKGNDGPTLVDTWHADRAKPPQRFSLYL